MRLSGIFIGLLCLWGHLLPGQSFPEKGIPPLQNYAPDDYGQAGKVWAIEAAENGLVYYASDKGLLEYDGDTWRRFNGSKGFTRSVLVASDSVIYTGSDKDFGVWKRQGLTGFAYESTYPFRESTKGVNEEFWGVYKLGEGIVFVSFDNLYLQLGDQLTKIPAPTRFNKSLQVDSSLYLVDEINGLYRFDGERLLEVLVDPTQAAWQIAGLAHVEDQLLVVMRDQGLFWLENGRLRPCDHEVTPVLQQARVFSFASLPDGHMAYGTILNGLYITNQRGEIIQHLNKQKGILNNTILSLYYSKSGELWLGMDYGISSLHLSSEVAYVFDQQGIFGTGQTACLQGNDFLLGTNQGLYYSSWDQLKNNGSGNPLRLVRGSTGQVWALSAIGDQIICGHDKGLFRVVDRRLFPLYTEEGILSVTVLDDRHLIAGTYNGLSLFEFEGNICRFLRKLPPVQGAVSQVISEADSILWINIPNFGIIRASLSPDNMITSQRIYRSETLKGEYPWLEDGGSAISIRTDSHLYNYLQESDSFMLASSPPQLPPVANRLPIWWSGLSLNEEFRFFPVYNGFALASLSPDEKPNALSAVLIRRIEAFNNDTSIVIGEGEEISPDLNNIRFQYLVPNQSDLTYRSRLTGFQEEWSEWTKASRRDFLHLPAGEYNFEVEARDGAGSIQQTRSSIIVGAPWYRRWYSYVGLILLVLGIFYLQRVRALRKLQRLENRLEAQEIQVREKQAVVYEHQKNLQVQQRLEAEIADLKKRLRAKTIELAKKGKENEDKNRLLQTLKQKLAAIEDRSSDPNIRWTEMSRLLEKKTSLEDHTFEMQIDELNQDFLRRLKADYPTLTTYDLRLATYLRMGLSSREIAELLHVLPSSVNVSRSRLRKKLGLKAETDLYEFLMGI